MRSRTSSSHSASDEATASPSTCRSFPSSPSRCWRARESARCTASSSVASAPNRCATASTTPGARLLVTADGGYRRGQIVPLKQMADEALRETPSIENVIIVQRGGRDMPVHVTEGRDHWYHRLMEDAALVCEPEAMDAEDMLYILYTSGTTGKPKGIVHTTGRISRRHLCHDEVGVRSSRRRCLLVHGGHRLGHGTQLRGVRPARERRDRRDVRRRARLAAARIGSGRSSNATA